MEKPSILIVDPDVKFMDEVTKMEGPGLVQFLTAHTRPQAQLLIADKKNFLAAMVFNSQIGEPYAVPLIRFAKAHRPSTPVFLIVDDEKLIPDVEIIKNLHLGHVFCKPFTQAELMSEAFPYTYFEMDKALELGKKDTTAVNADVAAEDKEMHPIAAKDFLCGSKCYFDVFIRLGSGRYVKLLKAGDAFDFKRIEEYLAKGVNHFYVRAEAQDFFLQYCDNLTGALLQRTDVSIEVKAQQVANLGKETADFLKNRGFNEATMQTAKQFVRHSTKLITNLKPDKNPALKQFLSNLALCEHGTGITMMVGLMLEALGFKDPKVLGILAMAGFLHDIGMMNMPPKFIDEDEANMTPEELKLYHTHPIVGHEHVKSIRLISPIIPATVLDHHERRTGKGFPNGNDSSSLSQVSEIVAIVDTFQQLLKRAGKNPQLDPIAIMRDEVFNDFSFPVIDAFSKAFLGSPVAKPGVNK